MDMRILALSDSVTVALAVLLFVAVILITSILKYRADDFVKFWAAVGTVLGLALGGVGTFFFTKDKVDEKESQLKTTQQALQTTQSEKADVTKQLAQYTNSKERYFTFVPGPSFTSAVIGWDDKVFDPKPHTSPAASIPAPVSPAPSVKASVSPAPSALVSPSG